jgi:hypothetical protein
MKKFITLISFALLLSACAPTATETVDAPAQAQPTELPSSPAQPQPTEASSAPVEAQPTEVSSAPVLFQIIKPDGTTFGVSLEAVKTLPLAALTVDGKVEEGPYLSDVLALAGITSFTEVSLTGSSSPATLTFEQVDKNTLLDFNNHGTMKLSTTYIPKANWTKDVAEIMVK